MADYLKKFATQSEYDAYIQAGYPKPNVSYIVDNDEIIFTNYQDGPAGPDTVLESVKIADFTGTTFGDYSKYVTDAYIPDGVTTIDTNAFSDCEGLTSVRIPNSVTTIGSNAFYGCKSMASVVIPESVTSIGSGAFYNCPSLTSVTIPDSVTSIGYIAFQACSKLTSVVIPDSVTTIGQSAFNNCRLLASVTVMATTPPTLGANAFSNTHADLVIYVPAESVDAYKAADGWSTYASKIQAITE